MILKSLPVLLWALWLLSLPLFASEKALVLFDFEGVQDTSLIREQDARYHFVKQNGNTVLQVDNGFAIREPGVKLLESMAHPWELTGRYQVKADIQNTGDESIQVEMFVGNDTIGLNRWFCSDYIDLEPGQSGTVSVNLSWTPWVFDPQLTVEGMRGVPGKIKTDLDAVAEIAISSRFTLTENQFTIDNVRVEGYTEKRDTTGFFPFVDEFGQYIHKDWPGKTHSVEDLKNEALIEEADWLKWPGPDNRGQYGGWAAGPRLEATGYFHTAKYQGKWWLVDPEGYLFWTSGLNCMSSWYGTTGISYREKYFRNLPDPKGEYQWFYHTDDGASHGFYKDHSPFTTYSFLMSNLYRKYGNIWMDTYRDVAHQRLRSWGMNTIGFMSDQEMVKQQKTPYVGSVWITGTPKIEGSEGFWGKFHDVFDPGFRATVRKSVEKQQNGAGDAWCIGYFVDNEMSWGQERSLALATLRSPAEQPAKQELVADLKARYHTIEALNAKWQMDYASWDELLTRTDTPNEQLAREDLDAFYRKIARTYFRTVNEELKRVAPHQNYLAGESCGSTGCSRILRCG